MHRPTDLAEAPLRAFANRPVGRLPAIPHLTPMVSRLASLTQVSPMSIRYRGSVDSYPGPIAKTAHAARQAGDDRAV